MKCFVSFMKRCVLLTDYNKRVTVPVLRDKQTKTIVNNESSEIIRMLNTEFNDFCKTEEQKQLDFYPENLRKSIDDIMSGYTRKFKISFTMYIVYQDKVIVSRSVVLIYHAFFTCDYSWNIIL